MRVPYRRVAGFAPTARWMGALATAWVALLTLSFTLCASARPVPLPFGSERTLDRWTVEDGFPDDSVPSIAQTSDLCLWFATGNGVVQFSGNSTTVLSPENTPGIPSSRLISLYADRRNRLWCSTAEGFAMLQGKTWTRPITGAEWSGEYGRAYAESSLGRVYIASSGGRISVTEGDRLDDLPIPTGATKRGYYLAVDTDDRLWSCQEGYLWRYDGRQWENLAGASLAPPLVVGIGPARGGGLWIVGRNEIRRVVNGLVTEQRRLSKPLTAFWQLLEDHQGIVWITQIRVGLFQVRPDGSVVDMRRESRFAYEGEARGLLLDHQGTLWIGTGTEGVYRSRPAAAQFLGREDGLPPGPVTSIAPGPDDRTVFIGCYNAGVMMFDGLKLSPPPWPRSKDSPVNVHSLVRDHHNHLWVAYMNGPLQRYDGSNLVDHAVTNLVGGRLTALFEDPKGQIWVGGDRGLAVGGANGFSLAATNLPILPRIPKHLAASSDGSVLLAMSNHVYRLRDREATLLPEVQLPNNVRFTSILEDSGRRLWLGTFDSGLHVLVSGKLRSIRPGRGLPPGRITSILEDRGSNLWFTVGPTLVTATAENLVTASTNAEIPLVFRSFDQSDGLRSGDFPLEVQPSASTDRLGRFWYASMHGVARIDPAALPPPGPQPRLQIERVSYLPPTSTERSTDGRLHPGQRVVLVGPFDDTISLPPGSRRLEIDFALRDFTSASKQRFQVRLNREEEWTDLGQRSTVYYDDLTPGLYELQARAAAGNGVWTSSPITAKLLLAPHFYETRTFRVSAAVGVLALTVLLVRRDAKLRWRHERERLEQKNKLAESQYRLVLILENTSDLVAFGDPAHRLLYINRAGRRLIGLSETASISEMDWPSLLAPWAASIVLGEGLAAAARHGSWQGESAIVRRDGREIPVSQVVTTHRDEEGRIDFVSTIMRDISAVKRAATINESLRRLAATLAAPLDYSEMGHILAQECREVFNHDAFFFAVLDAHGRPVSTPYAEDTPVGHRKPVAIHSTFGELSDPLQEMLRRDSKVLINRKDTRQEAQLTPFGVTVRPSNSLMFSTAHWEGRPVAVLSVQSYEPSRYGPEDLNLLQTVADQCGAAIARVGIERALREKEGQLSQAQKMQAIGTLAGGIAHDFNNILTGIVGNAGLLQMDLASDHPAFGSISEILKASRRAKDLVAQILTYSRGNSQQRQPVALWGIVIETLGLIRASIPATIEIQSHCSSPELTVLADPSQIHQVLMNLCTNAAHAMRGRIGRLELRQDRIDVNEPTTLHHHELKPGNYAHLVVSDNGEGMAADVLTRAFDPFFTTKEPGEGTGLGLSVVLGIMQSHDAVVAVDSQPGQGTSFHLFFPLTLTEADLARESETQELPKGKGEKVLLVDDETVVAALGRRILSRLGYEVASFTDPEEALAAFKADPGAFQLVITDLTMPRMTGFGLARAIRVVRADIPIALATGYGDANLQKAAADAGVNFTMRKPFSMQELARVAAQLLKPRRPSA